MGDILTFQAGWDDFDKEVLLGHGTTDEMACFVAGGRVACHLLIDHEVPSATLVNQVLQLMIDRVTRPAEDTPESIDTFVEGTIDVIDNLSPSQRAQFFESLFDNYCRHCGGYTPCNCTRDE